MYSIVLFTEDETDPRNKMTVKTGLTLEEAQAYCKREDTHGEGWFCGYTQG